MLGSTRGKRIRATDSPLAGPGCSAPAGLHPRDPCALCGRRDLAHQPEADPLRLFTRPRRAPARRRRTSPGTCDAGCRDRGAPAGKPAGASTRDADRGEGASGREPPLHGARLEHRDRRHRDQRGVRSGTMGPTSDRDATSARATGHPGARVCMRLSDPPSPGRRMSPLTIWMPTFGTSSSGTRPRSPGRSAARPRPWRHRVLRPAAARLTPMVSIRGCSWTILARSTVTGTWPPAEVAPAGSSGIWTWAGRASSPHQPGSPRGASASCHVHATALEKEDAQVLVGQVGLSPCSGRGGAYRDRVTQIFGSFCTAPSQALHFCQRVCQLCPSLVYASCRYRCASTLYRSASLRAT